MTKDEFDTWLKDPLTKEIFFMLSDVRKSINDELTNAETIFSDSSRMTLARLVGQREGLDFLLEIEFSDTVEEIDENDEYSAVRASNFN